MNYSVEAGSVKARVPVVIFRNKLAERTTYYLRLEILENDFFKTGVKTELHRTVVFSKDLLKPAGWGGYLESVVLGPYSINKHMWMIEQTGKKWDDEFLTALNDEPGSDMYWRDKLNEYLLEYNRQGNILLDDDNREITGFPE